MSTLTHPKALRNCVRAAVPVLIVLALVLLSGCAPLPAGQTPSTVTPTVVATAQVPPTTAVSSQPATPSTAPRAANTPTVEPPGTGAAEPTASYQPCRPSEEPDVFAMGAPDAGSLPPICITGFPPGSEVELWVTLPSNLSESFTELMDEEGTAVVGWSSATAFPEGTYTFDVVQGDLSATGMVEVRTAAGPKETGAGPQEPSPEPRAGEPSIEVYPAGDSGSEVEVALSGFEPNQMVELILSVATDETGSEFEEIDWLYLQADDKGATTYTLAIEPSDWPSSLFAVEYWPEAGEPIYVEFLVG